MTPSRRGGRYAVAGAVLVALALVSAMLVLAQETRKAQETKKAPEVRKAKLDELMKRVGQTYSQAECLFCHEEISPNIVKEFRVARDGEPTNTQCIDCHGTNHDVIIRSKGRVPAEICQECHAKRYEEAMAGGGHARAGSADWFQHLIRTSPTELIELTQSIGREVTHRCTSCHSRHIFSKDEAKDPRTCGVCHAGPEHPETEAYLNSKHGLIWQREGDTGRAPTCVTCHMIAGNHNLSGVVIYGSGLPKVPNAPFSPENRRKRDLQIRLCSECHSERFAKEQLELADQLYNRAHAAFDEAAGIVRALYEDGILPPAESRTHADLVEVEQRLSRFERLTRGFAWRTAVHGDMVSPAWNGWYRIQEELSLIRSEAARLRRFHRLEHPTAR
jgi:hypothetical protein